MADIEKESGGGGGEDSTFETLERDFQEVHSQYIYLVMPAYDLHDISRCSPSSWVTRA